MTCDGWGCGFRAPRRAFAAHAAACALGKLAPFLEEHATRLDEHEAALQCFQRKTAIYERALLHVQRVLDEGAEFGGGALADNTVPLPAIPAAVDGGGSYRSNLTTAPLYGPMTFVAPPPLDALDAVREQVARIGAAVNALDAKTDLAFLDVSHRAQDEAAANGAMMGRMRLKLQWLLSERQQREQREQPEQRQQPSGTPAREAEARISSPVVGGAVSRSTVGSLAVDGAVSGLERRPRGSSRQETKL